METQAILKYWFGHIKDDAAYVEERNRFWFGKPGEVDAYLTQHYKDTLVAAAEGRYDAFASEPKGRLALILLLDQFSRHIFRGKPASFAQDAKALGFTLDGMEKGFDKKLHAIERWFFYMPMQHSEDLKIQERSVSAFQELAEESPAWMGGAPKMRPTTPFCTETSSRNLADSYTAMRSLGENLPTRRSLF
jgi:uncharacterized protein (DUF924 family)